MRHVIKRKRHKEQYDKKKVYASVYAAAINCHYSEADAEKLANKVMKAVTKWIQSKPVVESREISQVIVDHLQDNDVITMYKEHLDIC